METTASCSGLSIRLTHIFFYPFCRNLCKDAFISIFQFDHCYTTNVDVVGCIANFWAFSNRLFQFYCFLIGSLRGRTKLQGFLTLCSVNYVTSTYQCNTFVLHSNYHRLGKSWCLHRSASIPDHMRIHRIGPVNWNKAANYHAQVQTVGDSGSLFNEERKTLD